MSIFTWKQFPFHIVFFNRNTGKSSQKTISQYLDKYHFCHSSTFQVWLYDLKKSPSHQRIDGPASHVSSEAMWPPFFEDEISSLPIASGWRREE